MKRLLLLTCAALGLSACAANYGPPPPGFGPPPGYPAPRRGEAPPARFDPASFAWSQRSGGASVNGQVGYRTAAGSYACAGAVVLIPETPYSRQRMLRLYGAADRAAVPIADVRERQATLPNDGMQAYVRTQRCGPGGSFTFGRLPPGSWFVIVSAKPVYGQGEQMVLLRRVQTSTNQPRQVVLR